MTKLRTRVEYEGQPYVDDPVYQTVMPVSFLIRASLADVFNSEPPEPLNILVGYQRKHFQWMQLDGKGGLVPVKNKRRKRG